MSLRTSRFLLAPIISRSHVNYALNVIADSSFQPSPSSSPWSQGLEQGIVACLQGGASLLQLRQKPPCTSRQFVEVAQRVKPLAAAYHVPLIINDRIDVALAVDADGVHLGQEDIPCDLVRNIIGPDRILGITVATPEQVDAAVLAGADYLGTDPIFPTSIKPDKAPLGIPKFRQLCERSCIPVLGIGGVNASNAGEVIQAGASGVAVISAVMNAPNVREATQALRHLVESSLPKFDRTLAQQAVTYLAKIRQTRPLIQHLTNFVVMNDNANVTLQVGASPVMSTEPELTRVAKAMVVNIGTLDHHRKAGSSLEATFPQFFAAVAQANEMGVPVILDPVAAGATPQRTELALALLRKHHIAVVRGNPGEIGTLAGVPAEVKGVDSVSGPVNRVEVVQALARQFQTTVVMTGKVDLISDGTQVLAVYNNHALLGTLTGTGCSCTSVVAAFIAATTSPREHAVAAAGALAYYCVAAERAARQVIAERKGPGTFRARFWDELYTLPPDQLLQQACIARII